MGFTASPGWGVHRGCSRALGLCGQCLGGSHMGFQWVRLALPGPAPGSPAGPRPTFVVQEVQGAGHVLHHHAGLQFIKVSPLVDVAQDGAWDEATTKEDTGHLRGRQPPYPGLRGPNAVLDPELRCAPVPPKLGVSSTYHPASSQTPGRSGPPPRKTRSTLERSWGRRGDRRGAEAS